MFPKNFIAPTNAQGFAFSEVDIRGFKEWMLQMINLGTQHLQLVIQASNHPHEHIMGKVEDYKPDGWITLRKYYVLMWSTSYRWAYNQYKVDWFPHSHWKEGTSYYGNLPNPWGDEKHHAELPWAFVRLGVRHNSGSNGKFQAYLNAKV